MNTTSILLLFFTALLFVGDHPIAAQAPDKSSKRPTVYALSIGIDKYQQKGIELRGAKRDAGLVADRISMAFNNKANLEQTFLFDESATREGIINALDSFARNSTPDDIVFFTYSGHGTQVKTESGTEGSLVPYDLGPNLQGMRASELLGQFRKIRAKTKIILIDGDNFLTDVKSALAAFTEPNRKLADLVQENYLIIGPSGEGHAYEGEFTDPRTQKSGVFGYLSYHFATGLESEADRDRDRLVDSKELELFLKNQLKKSLARFDDAKSANVIVLSSGVFDITSSKSRSPITKDLLDQLRTSVALQEPPPRRSSGAVLTRADVYMSNAGQAAVARNGDDYALLFANDTYDNAGWTKLQNPRNDVGDIANELKERYGFKEVDIKSNLSTEDIYKTIEAYQKKKFEKPDDQLFIFFAGHGVTDVISNEVRSGFYVGRDSPHPFTRRNSGEFVQLDRLLTAIDLIPVNYSMTVFDACFAGQIWKPALQLVSETAQMTNAKPFIINASAARAFSRSSSVMEGWSLDGNRLLQEISRNVYAKRKMKSRSRIIVTSGDRPVADAFEEPDGTLSRNSPFTDAFLRALRTGGGDDKVLTTAEVIPFIDKLRIEPQRGRLSGSDGEFVFVVPESKPPR